MVVLPDPTMIRQPALLFILNLKLKIYGWGVGLECERVATQPPPTRKN